MSRNRPSRLCTLALGGLLTGCLNAAGQTPAPAQGPQPAPAQPATAAPPNPGAASQTSAPEQSQVTETDVERIRRNLQLPPTLKLDEKQLRFYVQILAKQQSFAQYAKGYDWMNGGTKGGNPMTHAEFLSMVTPKEFYSSGGITATELLQGAIVNWLGQALIKRALNDISNAHSDKELQEIRDRIDRELAMLKKGGG